ncbi:ImpA family metalloprotease [Mollicutes bacterium LVI A0078]|nr:ImpA family metalloprotease [Mollicutes bacterium LVI A0075]WOO90458.1 ImpA family metalloprotease [Mollicutes bacterium LVI A0078]
MKRRFLLGASIIVFIIIVLVFNVFNNNEEVTGDDSPQKSEEMSEVNKTTEELKAEDESEIKSVINVNGQENTNLLWGEYSLVNSSDINEHISVEGNNGEEKTVRDDVSNIEKVIKKVAIAKKSNDSKKSNSSDETSESEKINEPEKSNSTIITNTVFDHNNNNVAEVGETLNYKIKVSNNEKKSALDVNIRDSLIEQINSSQNPYIEYNNDLEVLPKSSQFTGNLENGTFTLEEIEPGETVTLDFTVTVGEIPTNITQLTNVVTNNGVSPIDENTNQAIECNTDSQNCTSAIILTNASTQISKSVIINGEDQIASIGDSLIYTINIVNNESRPALNVVVKDSLLQSNMNTYGSLVGEIDIKSDGNVLESGEDFTGDLQTVDGITILEIGANSNIEINYTIMLNDIPNEQLQIENKVTDNGDNPLALDLKCDTDDCAQTITEVNPPQLLIDNNPNVSIQAMEEFSFSPIITTNSNLPISYAVSDMPEFLSFDSTTGVISGTPYYDDVGEYLIPYTASIGGTTAKVDLSLKVNKSKIEEAMAPDNEVSVPRTATYDDILERSTYISEQTQDVCQQIGTSLYGEGYNLFEPYNVTDLNSNWFLEIRSANTSNYPIMANSDGQVFSYYGNHIGTDFIVNGFIPFGVDMGSELYNSDYSIRQVQAITGDDDFFRNNKTIYSSKRHINFIKGNLEHLGIENNVSYTTDLDSDFDLVISYDMNNAIVDKAIEKQVPIIATYNGHFRGNVSYKRFGIELTLKKTTIVNDVNSFEEMCDTTSDFEKTFETLTSDSLEFVNKSEVCTSSIGVTSCKFNDMVTAEGESAQDLIISSVEQSARSLVLLDEEAKSVFDTDQEMLKLAVILADSFREQVSYPMGHTISPGIEFYRSYYADKIINYGREDNIVQTDTGTFGSDLSVINAYNLESHTINITPRDLADTYITGYYLKPGQTLTVTRNDTSSTSAILRLNTQRNGSSRIWDTGMNYIRPASLRSNGIDLKPGETYTYSSPHGGNIYVYTGAKVDDVDINLTVDGVLSYPVLRNADEISMHEYVSELESTPYQYTDIETPIASLHFKTSSAIESLDAYAPDSVNFLRELNKYAINGNYKYAGYENESIGELPTAVSDYFLNLGLTDYNNELIHKLPRRQEFNVDTKALCGSMCSGNPIDVMGDFDPLGWGENHEMGHNLQSNYIKIYGGRSSESSNNIFPINTIRQHAIDNGQDTWNDVSANKTETLWNLGNNWYLDEVEANSSHPLWVSTGTYANSGERLEVFMQILYASEDDYMYPKMYITSRLMASYDDNDSTWQMYKDKLGFSLYTMEEARAITGNDFMLIQSSYYSDKNLIDYFEGFGIGTSDLAKEQVLANNPTRTQEKGVYIQYYCSGKYTPVKMPEHFAPFGEGNTYMDNYDFSTSGCPEAKQTKKENVSEIEITSQEEAEVPSQEETEVPSQEETEVSSQEEAEVSSQEETEVPSQEETEVSSQEETEVSSQEETEVSSQEVAIT